MGDIISAAFWISMGVFFTLAVQDWPQESTTQQSVHYQQKADKTTDRLTD